MYICSIYSVVFSIVVGNFLYSEKYVFFAKILLQYTGVYVGVGVIFNMYFVFFTVIGV